MKNFGKFLLSLFICALLAVCSAIAVWGNHHWGYLTLLTMTDLFTTTSTDDAIQVGSISALIAFYICPAVTVGLVYGYLKNLFKFSKWWLIGLFGACAIPDLLFELGLDTSIDFIIVSSILGFAVSSILGSWLFKELKKRTNPVIVLWPGLAAIFLSSISTWILVDLNLACSFVLIFAFEGLAIIAASFMATVLCKSDNISKSITAGVLTCLPFFLYQFCNLLCVTTVLPNGFLAGSLTTIAMSFVWTVLSISAGARFGTIYNTSKIT